MFVGFVTRAHIVRAAYVVSGKSLKIKSVVQRRLDFLKAVRFGRYVLNELVHWASHEGPHSLGRIFILDKSLKIKSVVQHRLEFLRAVRFGRYVLNELVRWASHGGPHSLRRIFVFRDIFENQICGPASAGISEGRQIWVANKCMIFFRFGTSYVCMYLSSPFFSRGGGLHRPGGCRRRFFAVVGHPWIPTDSPGSVVLVFFCSWLSSSRSTPDPISTHTK